MFIQGPAGQIEAKLIEKSPRQFAVICHPHPLYGGTMNNKVVTTVEKALSQQNVTTIRFNFRGIGKSDGQYGHAQGEIEDALAVILWMKGRYPQAKMLLAGFSFGSYIALKAAAQLSADYLITIAPPVARFDYTQTAFPDKPWLIIQGDNDEVVAAEEVYAWANNLPPSVTLMRMAEASHFFHGRLLELQQSISRWYLDSNVIENDSQ